MTVRNELRELIKLSPDPEWNDYIFYSEDFVEYKKRLLADELLEKLFRGRVDQL